MVKPLGASFLVQRSTGKRIKLGGALRSQKQPPKAKKYAASRYQAAELPHRVDLRQYMTPVEDQSAVNSCTANAIVGIYEYLAKRALGNAGDVSRLFVYYNAREWDGITGDSGSTITGSIQVLQELGACTEATWPYNPSYVDKRPVDEAYEEAAYFLVEEAEEIPVDLYAMKHCLAEGYPFAFGLRLFQSFDKAGRGGKVFMPNPEDEQNRTSHANHAMLCVGYSDSKEVFIVRNSWGEDWGDQGYCYIPYGYMTNPEYCWDCWTIKSVSDLDFSAGTWYEDDQELYDAEADEESDDSDYEYYADDEEESEDEEDGESEDGLRLKDEDEDEDEEYDADEESEEGEEEYDADEESEEGDEEYVEEDEEGEDEEYYEAEDEE